MPDALEAGTQNLPGIAGLLEGIKYVDSLGGRAFTEADRLARRFVSEVEKNERVVLYGDIHARLRIPVVALNIKGIDCAHAAAVLFEKYSIAARAGGHCAPLMHGSLGTADTGAIRFSFSHLNDNDETDAAIAAVNQIARG
jgi:selenocysteine lyase/cysteine desulfurase